jgi:5-methylthioribose kinase
MKQLFEKAYPNALFLEATLSVDLENYLTSKKWFDKDEKVVTFEKPGEGNMNFVVRVITNKRTFILKQARPWVEKYPQIAAPIHRIEVENSYYKRIENNPFLQSFSPKVLGYDKRNFILALEDLGHGADFTTIYKKGNKLKVADLENLMAYLNSLHSIKKAENPKAYPTNMGMKKLNHEHIFHYPFLENNGFDLDNVQKGLENLSFSYKKNKILKKSIYKLGTLYLAKGNTLIHGDFYPGSWLKVESGVKVIDPEFSFYGYSEFDVGVLIAHLKMAQADESLFNLIMKQYKHLDNSNKSTIWAFVGIEIMRRLIGLAQLPLDLTLSEKEMLLKEASEYVLEY